MRVRLRESHADTAGWYYDRYPDGYQHTGWPDHIERVDATVEFTARFADLFNVRTVADFSCGDAAVVRRLTAACPLVRKAYLADVNINYNLISDMGRFRPQGLYAGPLPDTLVELPPEGVDLFICSETLEHVDDPDDLLRKLRERSRYLLVTTPEGETRDENHEHYWGWDSEAMGQMLHDAGWEAIDHKIFTPVSSAYYRFQMWICR